MKSNKEKLKIIDSITSDEVSLWHEESNKRLLEQLKIKSEFINDGTWTKLGEFSNYDVYGKDNERMLVEHETFKIISKYKFNK